jgi:hypothetical protein
VSLLLSLLEEYDNYVRFYTVQVLTILLTNRPQKLQEVRAWFLGCSAVIEGEKMGMGRFV